MTRLNIVIPARCEYPQLVWTVYSLISDVKGFAPFHVTVVSNGADETTKQMDEWFSKGTLARRGYLTVLSSEEATHPYTAVQKVSETLTEGIILICCGHITVQRDTVRDLMSLADRTKGYCHSPMLYMGDFPDKTGTRKLYGYKDPLRRGWSWQRIADEPYQWSGGGGGLTCVPLETWRAVHGCDLPFRKGIGGVEEYMDMKMWMLGKSVWIHPDCLYFHWAKNRGYTWKMHEHYWNQLCSYYTLKGREYMKQQNQAFTYPQSDSVLDEAEELCREKREWLLANQRYSLDEVLAKQPWLASKK